MKVTIELPLRYSPEVKLLTIEATQDLVNFVVPVSSLEVNSHFQLPKKLWQKISKLIETVQEESL